MAWKRREIEDHQVEKCCMVPKLLEGKKHKQKQRSHWSVEFVDRNICCGIVQPLKNYL